MKGDFTMNLYEAVSNNIKGKNELVDKVKQIREEYEKYIDKRNDLYLQIIDICPILNNEANDDLEFISYLHESIALEGLNPADALNTYLISKGYKDKINDFDTLVKLLNKYLSIL